MIQSPARLLAVRTMRETQFCRFGGRAITRSLIIHQLLGWWILFYSYQFCRKHCHILDDVIS
nr:MAG TPA: hypothetical protein [Caudoviricetes sp.]